MAGDVAVVVPYRGDDGGPRDKAWAYVQRFYRERHPGWQLVQGGCPPGPWVKALAVADALSRTDADLILVADGDCLSDGVDQAVESVRSKVAAWAVPHWRVYRLTEAATTRVLAGEPLPPIPDTPRLRRRPGERPRPWRAPDFAEVHPGMVGGGLVVLPRALYEEAPMDPRFAGFGNEDSSWGRALGMLASGPVHRGDSPLVHLWHPPQPRLTRAVGSLENQALGRRYRAATTPGAMRALIDEFHTRTPVS